jgi:hypothetical protein
VDDEAFVTVIAVTRGLSNFPTQVLYPATPVDSGKLHPGEQARLRSLNDNELVHLVSMGEAPIIIGFASRSMPDRSGFVVNKRWGKELFLETESSTPEELAKELALILFGSTDAVYDVEIRGATRPLTSPRTMAFNGNAPSCGVFGAGYSVYGRLGAGSVRYAYGYSNGDLPYSQFGGRFNPQPLYPISLGWPFAMSSAMYYAFAGEPYALNYPESGCDVYRVAWYRYADPDLAYFYRGPGTRRPRPPLPGGGPGDTIKGPTDTATATRPRRHPRDLPLIDPTRATGVSGDRVRAIATAGEGDRGVGRRLHPRTMVGDLLERQDQTRLDWNRRTSDAGPRGRVGVGAEESVDYNRDARRFGRDGSASTGQTPERQAARPVTDGEEVRRAPRAAPPAPVQAPAPAPLPVESRRVERTVDNPSSKAPAGNPGTP